MLRSISLWCLLLASLWALLATAEATGSSNSRGLLFDFYKFYMPPPPKAPKSSPASPGGFKFIHEKSQDPAHPDEEKEPADKGGGGPDTERDEKEPFILKYPSPEEELEFVGKAPPPPPPPPKKKKKPFKKHPGLEPGGGFDKPIKKRPICGTRAAFKNHLKLAADAHGEMLHLAFTTACGAKFGGTSGHEDIYSLFEEAGEEIGTYLLRVFRSCARTNAAKQSCVALKRDVAAWAHQTAEAHLKAWVAASNACGCIPRIEENEAAAEKIVNEFVQLVASTHASVEVAICDGDLLVVDDIKPCWVKGYASMWTNMVLEAVSAGQCLKSELGHEEVNAVSSPDFLLINGCQASGER